MSGRSTTKTGAVVTRPRGRGRPRVHSEPWSKVSVVLFDRHVQTLDALCGRMHDEHTIQVSRAGLVRLAIDLLDDTLRERPVPQKIVRGLARTPGGPSRIAR